MSLTVPSEIDSEASSVNAPSGAMSKIFSELLEAVNKRPLTSNVQARIPIPSEPNDEPMTLAGETGRSVNPLVPATANRWSPLASKAGETAIIDGVELI